MNLLILNAKTPQLKTCSLSFLSSPFSISTLLSGFGPTKVSKELACTSCGITMEGTLEDKGTIVVEKISNIESAVLHIHLFPFLVLTANWSKRLLAVSKAKYEVVAVRFARPGRICEINLKNLPLVNISVILPVFGVLNHGPSECSMKPLTEE